MDEMINYLLRIVYCDDRLLNPDKTLNNKACNKKLNLLKPI